MSATVPLLIFRSDETNIGLVNKSRCLKRLAWFFMSKFLGGKAVGLSSDINIPFDASTPYFFRIAATSTEQAEQDLRNGLREITTIFAKLSGRSDLDLFRPLRG